MKTYINFNLRDLNAQQELALPFKIKNAELEVEYEIDDLEDEQGIYGYDVNLISKNIILIDKFVPTDAQNDIILKLMSGYDKELKEMVIDEYKNF